MDFLFARSWDEALDIKARRPDAVPISGGTDLMVELNFGRRRPDALLDLNGVAELASWELVGAPAKSWSEAERFRGVKVNGVVRIGAALPFTRIIDEIAPLVPALAIASRTVGSPQIRNRGTLGGNLATASPAGDALPPLVTVDATVEVASARGARSVPVRDFFTGPKRSVLAPDELIKAAHVPVAAGPQQFAKIGTRNAMVIAVCSFALALHPGRRTASGCIGSAGPTVLPTPEAEQFLAAELDWDADLDEGVAARFGELVAATARPIDDVRGSADYRRHALAVLARRTLTWCWDEYRGARR